jgi:hypothetical protein
MAEVASQTANDSALRRIAQLSRLIDSKKRQMLSARIVAPAVARKSPGVVSPWKVYQTGMRAQLAEHLLAGSQRRALQSIAATQGARCTASDDTIHHKF